MSVSQSNTLDSNGSQSENCKSFSTLDTIEPGTTVVVQQLAASNPELYCKLHAMGLVSGSSVTVVGRAPLGDPISVSTMGYQLSLRLAEARSIGVVAP